MGRWIVDGPTALRTGERAHWPVTVLRGGAGTSHLEKDACRTVLGGSRVLGMQASWNRVLTGWGGKGPAHSGCMFPVGSRCNCCCSQPPCPPTTTLLIIRGLERVVEKFAFCYPKEEV